MRLSLLMDLDARRMRKNVVYLTGRVRALRVTSMPLVWVDETTGLVQPLPDGRWSGPVAVLDTPTADGRVLEGLALPSEMPVPLIDDEDRVAGRVDEFWTLGKVLHARGKVRT